MKMSTIAAVLVSLPALLHAAGEGKAEGSELTNLIGEVARSYAETFTTFEADYRYSTKFFPGYSDWMKSISEGAVEQKPWVDKDGNNEVMDVKLKRRLTSYYINVDNQFNGGTDVTEFHSDGTLVWEHRHVNQRVNILSQLPKLPFLYDNLLKLGPADQGRYTNPLQPLDSTFVTLLTGGSESIEVLPQSDGNMEVRILQPSQNPLPGMKLLHRLMVGLKPALEIKSYSFGAFHREGDKTHVFHPIFEAKYSDYREIKGGAPRLPGKIEITEFRKKNTVFSKTVEELIANDRGAFPIKVHTIELKRFEPNPQFAKGELEFAYPVGTQIVDMFANRVYLMGDTLKILKEKLEDEKK